jgi:hypothetical protein
MYNQDAKNSLPGQDTTPRAIILWLCVSNKAAKVSPGNVVSFKKFHSEAPVAAVLGNTCFPNDSV